MTALTGLGRLVRLVLRRDRVRLPVWILALSVFIVSSAASLVPLYPDQQSIDDYARLFSDNPALVAFAGPGYGFGDPNLGVILVNETQLWGCIGFALMSIFLVNRHTRAEEDAERTEVLRSSVVGRHAPAAAAVLVVGAANLVIAAVCLVGFLGLGYDAAGSVALAGAFAGCGLAFTGVAAVTSQLAGGSRSSLGLAAAVLGAAFVLRAVGDIGENFLRWLSPIGWAQGVRAYAGERWWTLALCFLVAAVLVLAGFWLATRRDLGSGILPQRPGPARAAPWITTPLGLAVRLQRGSVIAWSAGLFITGVVYGSIGEDVEEMIEENPTFADFLAQIGDVDITASFFATAMGQLAMLGAGFAISSALRLRSEEAAGRVEAILATGTSRRRWAASHLLVAAVGTVVVMGAGGLGTGISYAIVSRDAGQVLRLTGAALVTVPAVLALVGVAVVLFGIVPGRALLAWAGLAVVVVVQLFGELLQLPEWSRRISPLDHTPALPAEDLRIVPLLVLGAIAVVTVVAGLSGFRERDVRTS